MSDESIQLACPHCAAINRIDQQRVAESPRCGRCHDALFTAAPVSLTAITFDSHAVRTNLPLLVDFWAPWCGPCQSMAPQFAAAAKQLEPDMRLAKVDTEAEPALGSRYGIRSIPTLLLIQSGKELARQSGAMSADQIVQWARMQLMTD